MAYTDMSAHWAYKNLITYQDLNQLGANDAFFKLHDHDGTDTPAIDSNADIKQGATKKIFFDGGSDTYIVESSANVLSFYAGGALNFQVIASGISTGENMSLQSTKVLYFDGGSDTYIYESAANTLSFKAGNALNLQITTGGVSIGENLTIQATKLLYLDGGSNTYITESSADTIDIRTGGSLNFQLDATHLGTGGDITMVATKKLYMAGSGTPNSGISTSTGGTGTTTLYIGNATITVASDLRLKRDIENTKIDAIEDLNKLRVIDFNWNDPSDNDSPYNRNSRGRWTGVVAQEVIDVFPYIINAPDKTCPKCRKGEECKEHGHWFIEYQQLVPVLIKAIQELSVRTKYLEGKLNG